MSIDMHNFNAAHVSIAFRLNVRLRVGTRRGCQRSVSLEVSIAFRLNVRLRDGLKNAGMAAVVATVSQLPFG